MATYVAGIDFGTTNSSAAVYDGKSVHMIEIESGRETIPTALFFSADTNKIYYGRDAQHQYMDEDESGRFIRSIKNILGSQIMHESTIINGKPIKFGTIIELFIKHIKQKIDAAIGTNIESVVMGRPVHFCDDDSLIDAQAQDVLKQAAIAAGFKNVVFQYEPIAAAFTHEQKLTSEKLAFVVDIGGGTSDFTVIKLSPERKLKTDRSEDVLSHTGVHIGGNNFDKELSMKSFMPYFGLNTEYKSSDKKILLPTAPFFSLSTWHSVNDVYNQKVLNQIHGYVVWGCEPEKTQRLYEIVSKHLGHKNLEYVETTKIALSSSTQSDIVLDFLSDKPTISTKRESFEEAIKTSVNKIENSIHECLKNANVKNTDIELVILTGGSTEIPFINRAMQSYFPNATLSSENKLASVGMGLAYDAARRFCNLNK